MQNYIFFNPLLKYIKQHRRIDHS